MREPSAFRKFKPSHLKLITLLLCEVIQRKSHASLMVHLLLVLKVLLNIYAFFCSFPKRIIDATRCGATKIDALLIAPCRAFLRFHALYQLNAGQYFIQVSSRRSCRAVSLVESDAEFGCLTGLPPFFVIFTPFLFRRYYYCCLYTL